MPNPTPPAAGNRPGIYAHRGASAVRPENTVAAFKRALVDGADGIEFDLRITADRRWVIAHNATATIAGRTITVARATSDEIAALREADDAESDRVACPSLSEFLGWGDGKVDLIYDIKDVGFERELVDAIELHPSPEWMMISAFRRQVLAEVKRLRPDWRVAWIVGNPGTRFLRNTLFDRILKRARALGVDALHLHDTWGREPVIARCRDAGIETGFWTIDDKVRSQELAGMGATSVITDDPAALSGARRVASSAGR